MLGGVDPSGEWVWIPVVIVLVAITGCSDDEPEVDCTDPCKQALDMGLDKPSAGGVVCCNGKKYSCAWHTDASTEKGGEIIAKCLTKHEDDHHDDIDCPKTGGVTRPPFKKGKDRNVEECAAYKIELDCLEKSREDCGDDRGCKLDVDSQIDGVKLSMRKFCK